MTNLKQGRESGHREKLVGWWWYFSPTPSRVGALPPWQAPTDSKRHPVPLPNTGIMHAQPPDARCGRSSQALKLECVPGSLHKCRFWVGRSGVKPEIAHFL